MSPAPAQTPAFAGNKAEPLKPFDLGQHLFDTAVAMTRVRMMELGITPAPKAPRIRQLDVRDDHIPELLAGITDLILARRRAGMPVGIAAEEMQAALTAMLQS